MTVTMPGPHVREAYQQSQRKLVLAFDIGTIFSAASFSCLEPGRIPIIQGVTSYPGQHSIGGSSKIPSVICYDSNGTILAAGEEASKMQTGGAEDDPESESEDGWGHEEIAKVEGFKSHLHPNIAPQGADSSSSPLPPGKSAVEVLGDFLHYLYTCSRIYIEDTVPAGEWFWKSEENATNIEFVLTHPSEWKGPQQVQMQEAAIHAGLIEDTPSARARVHFATENEANLHYCINKGLLNGLPVGESAIIIDAGGGTIDSSTYQKSKEGVYSFSEIAKPACIRQGSATVNIRAKRWLSDKLDGSVYTRYLDHMMQIFDATSKLTVKNANDPFVIRFGEIQQNAPALGIISGQIRIPGPVAVSFFTPSVEETVLAIKGQLEEANQSFKTAFLVGGFAANAWIFSELRRQLSELDISLTRPDGFVNKAVVDGAILSYLDQGRTEIEVWKPKPARFGIFNFLTGFW